MIKLKIITVSSIVANIVLLFILFKSSFFNKSENNISKVQRMPQDKDLSNRYNFEKIFIEKNDSLYKAVFNKSFQDLPIQAYLLACTYYMIKKDSSVKIDIEMISSEIKGIYGKSPDLVLPN